MVKEQLDKHINYHNITHNDMLNGDGLRVVLWVSGCSHGCKNCQNQQTWNPYSGNLFELSELKEIYEQLDKEYISGITYTGGDPLFIDNRPFITWLAKEIRKRYPNKTQWLWTGYSWDEIKYLEVIDYIDVLVDGKYIDEIRDVKLKYRGSSNQRVIDVKKSKLMNAIVLHCD